MKHLAQTVRSGHYRAARALRKSGRTKGEVAADMERLKHTEFTSFATFDRLWQKLPTAMQFELADRQIQLLTDHITLLQSSKRGNLVERIAETTQLKARIIHVKFLKSEAIKKLHLEKGGH